MADEKTTQSKDLRNIVFASSAGTAFEWYDFFIFGALASIIAKNFFAGMSDSLAFFVTLATFAVGFIFRPLGALVFGHIGDKKGRKGTFLYTILLMGVATIAIGCLPNYAMAGPLAPILLILMRMVQGFALGGEYGGAAIYVAEHAPDHKRGAFTGWIQTSAAFGLMSALGVILATRTLMGEEAFLAWGWRIPFWLSAGLLAVSVYIRAKTHESPTFKAMERDGTLSRSPLKDALSQKAVIKNILIALFGFMCAQGVIWYTSFFYTQVFLEKTVKIDPSTVNWLIVAMTVVSAPLYVVFATLSDRIGRRPVMLFGIGLATVSFFFGFDAMIRLGNPDLVKAQAQAPVVLIVDQRVCTSQFDPTGTKVFSSSCDVAKSLATQAGIRYALEKENLPTPLDGALSPAYVRVGDQTVSISSLEGQSPSDIKAYRAQKAKELQGALTLAGYPLKADPAKVNFLGIFMILMLFATACTALYGPMAALLVEMFPSQVRYTGLSIPYNIGTGWFGGLQPAISFAIVAASGHQLMGLWYPVGVGAVSFVLYFFFVKETKGRDLSKI